MERKLFAENLSINQRLYLENMLKKFAVAACKPVETPLEQGKKH